VIVLVGVAVDVDVIVSAFPVMVRATIVVLVTMTRMVPTVLVLVVVGTFPMLLLPYLVVHGLEIVEMLICAKALYAWSDMIRMVQGLKSCI